MSKNGPESTGLSLTPTLSPREREQRALVIVKFGSYGIQRQGMEERRINHGEPKGAEKSRNPNQ
jgi:hypothetical protein